MSTVDPGPVEAALDELRAWLADATSLTAVVGTATGDAAGRVLVRPVAVLPDHGGRGGGPVAPLRLRVRYAVLVDLPVADAAAVLDRLLTALVTDGRYRLVLDAPSFMDDATPADRWPPLLLDVPVRVDAPAPTVPRVRGELRLVDVSPRTLRGRLFGPGDIPLPGMTVTAQGTGTRTTSDENGWFALPGQPADRPVALHLTGRGLHLEVDVTPSAADPVVVHCQIEET